MNPSLQAEFARPFALEEGIDVAVRIGDLKT